MDKSFGETLNHTLGAITSILAKNQRDLEKIFSRLDEEYLNPKTPTLKIHTDTEEIRYEMSSSTEEIKNLSKNIKDLETRQTQNFEDLSSKLAELKNTLDERVNLEKEHTDLKKLFEDVRDKVLVMNHDSMKNNTDRYIEALSCEVEHIRNEIRDLKRILRAHTPPEEEISEDSWGIIRKTFATYGSGGTPKEVN